MAEAEPAAVEAAPKRRRARKGQDAPVVPLPTDLALLDSCERCPALVTERLNGGVSPVRIMGSKKARVLVVMDNPQTQEAYQASPDWGRDDWQSVIEGLSSAEFTFDEVAVAFATRCAVGRVSDKAKLLKADVLSACRPWLHLELAEFPEVRAVICLGRIATAGVLGIPLTAYSKARGKVHDLLLGERTLRVIPSLHPFQVLTSPFDREAFEMDFRQLRAAADPDYAPFDMARHQETHADRYHLVDTVGALQAMVDRLVEAPLVAFDIESRGLDPFHLPTPDPLDAGKPLRFVTSIQFSDRLGESFFVPVCHKDFNCWEWEKPEQWLDPLRFFFESYRGTLVAYNGKFDQTGILHDFGVLPGLKMDPMIVDQLRRGMPARSLKKLAWVVSSYGGYETQLKSAAPAGHVHDSYYYPLDELFWYGCLDTDVTFRAAEKFLPVITADATLKRMSDFLASASGVLSEIAVDGWRVDLEYLEKYGAAQLAKVQEAKAQIRAMVPEAVAAYEKRFEKEFDPSSTKALGFLLFDLLGLPAVERTDTGAPSTDKAALSAIESQHPIIPLILAMRAADKCYSAFYKRWKAGVAEDGRLHFGYNLIKFRDADTGEKGGTETGRLSSSGAAGNVQQIKKDPEIRKTFLPDRPGDVLIDIDFSTLEYVVAAIYSRDPKLCEAFRKGYDIHSAVAAEMFGLSPEEMSKPENKPFRKKGKCFHPDTEVLTRLGWKRILDLQSGEEVIQATPEPEHKVRLEWVVPTEVFSQYHDAGSLVHLKNEGIDLRVTPDHRMLTWGMHGKHRVVFPESLPRHGLLVNAGVCDAGGCYVDSRILRLAVAVQADGSYAGDAIRFGFTKRRKYLRLLDLLGWADSIEYSYGKRREGMYWVRIGSGLSSQIRALLDGKKLPWWWLTLNVALRSDVLDEARFWDSCTRPNWTMYVYSSKEEQNVDVLQALASIQGYKTRKVESSYETSEGISPIWNLSVKAQNCTGTSTVKAIRSEWTDKVACLAVPSTFVLVRDGGIPVVTGQTMNFSALYGAGPENVADQLHCSKEEAEEFLKSYYAKFPGLTKWIASAKKAARKTGRATSKMGRFRALPDAMLPDTRSNKGRIEAALRQAVNGPIQGDASDICLWGLVRVAEVIRELKLRTRIKATIHDAIILSSPPEEVFDVIEIVREILTHPGLDWLDGDKGPGVPLRVSVEIGETWGDMEDFDAAD